MKPEVTYLVPYVFNGRNVPMEYQVKKHRHDMRFSFCKKNEKNIIEESKLSALIEKMSPIVKENRIIMRSAAHARQFSAEIAKGMN